MKKEKKILLVEDLSKKFDKNNIIYIMDASGLSVSQINNFREKCFKQNVEYKVVKNSFIKKALKGSLNDFSPIINGNVLKGFSGILFSKISPSAPAKILKQFRKMIGNDHPKLKAASIGSDFYLGDEHLSSLSELKGKNELLSDVVNLLQSPISNVINLLKSAENKISNFIKQLEKNNLQN